MSTPLPCCSPLRSVWHCVVKEVDRQLETLPTAPVARKVHRAQFGASCMVRSLEEAVEISNRFAPEHLSIPDASLLPAIRHAGSVFVGPFSPEAAGDYASGPNHVLPTGGAARIRGGLAVTDFLKVISVQELSAAALAPGARHRHSGARRRPRSARASVEVGPNETPEGAVKPRPRVQQMAPYSPPTGGRRASCASISTRIPWAVRRASSQAIRDRVTADASPSIPNTGEAKQAIAAYFHVSPSSSSSPTAPTKPSRSSSTHTWTMGRKCWSQARPTPCIASTRKWPARRSRRSPTRCRAWSFRLQEVLDAITPETRAVLLANPNNPTGTGISLLAIERILHRARKAAVLVDEAYYEFCGVTALTEIERVPNLFVCRTFSKVFGMAAMRLGCLFSHEANIAYLHKAQSPYSVNALAVLAARSGGGGTALHRRLRRRSAGGARNALRRSRKTGYPLRAELGEFRPGESR